MKTTEHEQEKNQ